MVKVFGEEGPKLVAFAEQEASHDDFRPKDHIGEVAVITVNEVKTVPTKRYGDKDAVSCDVIAENGTQYEDVLFFQAAIVGQLRGFVGQQICAAFVSYTSKFGNEAVKLGPPNAKQQRRAEDLLG